MTKLSFEMFGNYKTILEGVAATAKLGDNGNKRVAVYVKSGIYNKYVEIGPKSSNLLLLNLGPLPNPTSSIHWLQYCLMIVDKQGGSDNNQCSWIYGNPIEIYASGWKACILQHECDDLEGALYVDIMVPRTFRIVENLDLPLPDGCPKLGIR
ncbi:hypothetical protein G4B88_030369 [Cannabis sativa]|uniref:Peptide deformylase n=1 Tax=Cannabis sativa TaxID=3483 RepID=A0A7J6E0I0_CANSA|nr:hypothetical protein G4B88_030369 [Cannabis sativa]